MGRTEVGPSQPPAPTTTDSWDDKDQQIQVAEDADNTLRLKLRSKVAGHPSTIYQILVDPDAVDVFRNIKVSFHAAYVSHAGYEGRRNKAVCCMRGMHANFKSWQCSTLVLLLYRLNLIGRRATADMRVCLSHHVRMYIAWMDGNCLTMAGKRGLPKCTKPSWHAVSRVLI